MIIEDPDGNELFFAWGAVRLCEPYPTKMPLIEDGDVVQTLVADRADDAFDIGILPGRARGRADGRENEGLDRPTERRVEGRVAVVREKPLGPWASTLAVPARALVAAKPLGLAGGGVVVDGVLLAQQPTTAAPEASLTTSRMTLESICALH
jgi:hypothetical protein